MVSLLYLAIGRKSLLVSEFAFAMIAIFQTGGFGLHHISAKNRRRSVIVICDEFYIWFVSEIDERILCWFLQFAAGLRRACANQ